MDKQFIIRIDEAMKERFAALARSEGKTASQVVRELIEQYITERDLAGYVDATWESMGKRLLSQGFKESDIPELIETVRKSRP